jgi:dihydroorotate dehydrogenase electron transfer subunit
MKNPEARIERQLACEVVENSELAPANPDHFRLTINAPYIAANAKPGQFIHILPPSENDMLRRPLSIMDADRKSGSVTVIYRVIGEGTRIISQVKPGKMLDIIGPLGNGFPIMADKPAILLGGGVGIPPLVFLAKMLMERNADVKAVVGAREPCFIICLDDFTAMGLKPDIFVEDKLAQARDLFGKSAGRVEEGLITRIFEGFKSRAGGNPVIYACGPIPMLKAVAGHSKKIGLECYVSLENKLACGLGACLGCSIPVRKDGEKIEYRRVCTDGPVFDASMVDFDKL